MATAKKKSNKNLPLIIKKAKKIITTSSEAKCGRCGKAAGHGECPYQSEINNIEEECDCCTDCRHECTMDI